MFHHSKLGTALFLTYTFLQSRLATAQLIGSINHYGDETDGFLSVTVENNGTANYSIEARNNLFDDLNPYRPLVVKNLAGQIVPLVGTLYPYGSVDDSAFIGMSPGSIWQRILNMTEYIEPDTTASQPHSECFSVGFPSGIFAVNTTDFVAGENLATGFLGHDAVELFVAATPLHLNITVGAGLQAEAQATTAAVGVQAPATLVAGTGTGLGASTPSVGSNINDYLGGAVGIFAKEVKAYTTAKSLPTK